VGVERVLRERESDLCVVAGDVNSTLAAALAAAKVGVRLAHIESGLRSFDRTMPEEHNRKLTDHLSDVLLAHSADALENLQREGIPADTVHLVGNTMIDTLLAHVDRARSGRPWEQFEVEPAGYGLVTLHRQSLFDTPGRLAAAATGLTELAADFPLVFPLHPRTAESLEESGDADRLRDAGVHLSPPLGYLDFLGLEAEAAFVLTDSGGVQEETSALGVRCFTLRDTTERPVTLALGTNTLLGARPERIREIPELLTARREIEPIPLWDGHAAERAAGVLGAFLRSGRESAGVA
jgi:UDP-N-acetylglucosamine 2-epimerase (non-hydrolysing)